MFGYASQVYVVIIQCANEKDLILLIVYNSFEICKVRTTAILIYFCDGYVVAILLSRPLATSYVCYTKKDYGSSHQWPSFVI